ncbi:MAG: hypothetical protein AVDCRST_MAG64-570, partial [uncultured Phycisphaerae bacterium]
PRATLTRPPRSVNFTALFTRFQTTCRMRSGSTRTRPARSSSAASIATPLASAAARTASSASRTTGTRSASRTLRWNLPDAIRDTSSRSSITCRWASAPCRTVAATPRTSAGGTAPPSSSLAQIRIDVSGVRSS